jgi:hypothetical protein
VAVAACLTAVVGVGVVNRPEPPQSPQPVVAAMNPVDQDIPLTATIGYWPRGDGGTTFKLTCYYPPGSTSYPGSTGPSDQKWNLTLWVLPRSGAPAMLGGWPAGPGVRVVQDDDPSLSPGQIARWEIRHDDKVLLAYQPD